MNDEGFIKEILAISKDDQNYHSYNHMTLSYCKCFQRMCAEENHIAASDDSVLERLQEKSFKII